MATMLPSIVQENCDMRAGGMGSLGRGGWPHRMLQAEDYKRRCDTFRPPKPGAECVKVTGRGPAFARGLGRGFLPSRRRRLRPARMPTVRRESAAQAVRAPLAERDRRRAIASVHG